MSVPTNTKTVGVNLLWLVLSGFWLFLSYLLAGVVLCLTFIGIPFGVQSIKMAGLALQPFGKKIVRAEDQTAFYSDATAAA